MVGVSKDPKKTSTIVMKYMQDYGFKIYPVNPSAKGETILGEKVYAKITDINENQKIVIVDDLVATGGTAIACAELLTENFNVKNKNMNKVIVTGGLGFIGSNLIKLLLKKKYYDQGMYTSLTRVREKLIVINLLEKYREFGDKNFEKFP